MRTSSICFISFSLAVMALTGCSSDSGEPEAGIKECPAFTATIGGVESRATDHRWDREDEIGITGAGRSNVCYHTPDGSGNFSVKTIGEQIYFQDANRVTFTAYYPWDALSTNGRTITADTRTQTRQKNFDFLWAQGEGHKNAPDVTFNFEHRMAKLVLTIKPGDGMSYEEMKGATLSLEGFRHTGSFDVATGTATADAGAPTDKWVFNADMPDGSYGVADDTAKTVTYTLILFPQLHGAPVKFLAELPANELMAEIDFTAANREKDGPSGSNEWVAGRQYNLSLTLHKSKVTSEGCTINPWNSVSTGEIVVD